MELETINAVMNIYTMWSDSTSMRSFQQIKLQNSFDTTHHTFTTVFPNCKNVTMSQKHRKDQTSFVRKIQAQIHVIVKYADLIHTQTMDEIVVTEKLDYNIIIWLLNVCCDTHNLFIETQAMTIRTYFYISNSRINSDKMLYIHLQQCYVLTECSKNPHLYFQNYNFNYLLTFVHIHSQL